jgi:(R,R)-butanediol dehydrogenase/meso-butanediol dehydrogenase/diacetyl reductase
MKAGVWEGIGRIDCRSWDDPRPGPDEVLVRVAYCGFCGSDPHIIEGNLPIGAPPQVLGHEVAGEIVEIGAAVRGLTPGLRVGCNLYAYCGRCPWCQAGQPNHCRRKYFSAKGFAELALYRPEQLFVLPDELSLEIGALLEPVATCLHAVEIADVRLGDHVLVIGAGPLGLIVAQLAKASGAATVTVSEPREANRELALALGADAAVDPVADDLSAVARSTGDRGGYDVVFEVAGVPAALQTAPGLCSTRGRVVVVGVFARAITVPFNPYDLYEREISVRGAIGADRTFQRAVDLMPGLVLQPLITAIEPLDRIGDVYRAHKAGGYVKALIEP